MLDTTGQITPPPWYRQFWPWFLIALPATIVVACFFMLYLAIKYSDDLVSDNYYRDGLAINRVLTQDIRATELGLSANLSFDRGSDAGIDVLALTLRSSTETFVMPTKLNLHLLHPGDASADHVIQLMAAGDGRFRGQLPALPAQSFYLRLVPTELIPTELTKGASAQERLQSAAWRLAGAIDFTDSHIVELRAEPERLNSSSD